MLAQEQPSKKVPNILKMTKRCKVIREKIDRNRVYPIAEAIGLLKACPQAKFKKNKESVDVSVRLGVDPRKSDQVVRGATVLPHGIGREVRVAVFAEEGDAANEAR